MKASRFALEFYVGDGVSKLRAISSGGAKSMADMQNHAAQKGPQRNSTAAA
jgi:hypothetical protein